LILTKPIGTGILSTALKQGVLPEDVSRVAVQCMLALNRDAADVMDKFEVHACTDVTGFGLLGHLLGMMRSSGTSAVIQADSVPVLSGVLEQVVAGIVPGGTKNNSNYTKDFVQYTEKITPNQRLILNDAQTSGGLLISLPQVHAADMVNRLREKGVESAKIIGRVVLLENHTYIRIE